MKRISLLLITSFLFTSCTEHYFDEKFIQGTIVGVSDINEYGLVEFNNGDHFNGAYMALYFHDEVNNIDGASNFKLGEKYYFKVKKIKTDNVPIPLAYDFKKSKPNDMFGEGKNVGTTLNYHAMVKHGENRGSGAHRRGHLPQRAIIGDRGNYKVKIEFDGIPGFNEIAISDIQKSQIDSIKPGIVFIEYNIINGNYELISIDLCHYHDDIKIECRDDQP